MSHIETSTIYPTTTIDSTIDNFVYCDLHLNPMFDGKPLFARFVLSRKNGYIYCSVRYKGQYVGLTHWANDGVRRIVNVKFNSYAPVQKISNPEDEQSAFPPSRLLGQCLILNNQFVQPPLEPEVAPPPPEIVAIMQQAQATWVNGKPTRTFFLDQNAPRRDCSQSLAMFNHVFRHRYRMTPY